MYARASGYCREAACRGAALVCRCGAIAYLEAMQPPAARPHLGVVG
jgi:hypothetical protein